MPSSLRRVCRRAGHRGTPWLLCILLFLALPTIASAHGKLKSSAPAADARLTAVPRLIRLDFTEVPELAVSSIQLLRPDGSAVLLGPIHAAPDSPQALLADISGSLDAGVYTVVWRMVGADGHPVTGRFGFTITPGSAGVGETPADTDSEVAEGGAATAESPPNAAQEDAGMVDPESGQFDAESPAYVVIRWLQFAGLLVVLGAVVFQTCVLGLLRRKEHADSSMIAVARHRAASAGLVAAGVVGLSAILRLGAQSYAIYGSPDAWQPALVGVLLGRTLWGWGWLVQVAAVALAIFGFAAIRRGKGSGWAVAGAAVLAFTPALAGHAAAAPRLTTLAIVADGMHVIGAGGWLGTLLIVVTIGIAEALGRPAAERGRAVADLVNAFSPTALVFAGLAVATGVFAAWIHLGGVTALWQTRYGLTLLLKLGIISLVAGTGAYNWLRVKPGLGDVDGARRIRRSAAVELMIGVLVLAVTAVLVGTPT